jgi:hypothetical protein
VFDSRFEVANRFDQFINGAFHVVTDIFDGIAIPCSASISFGLSRAHWNLSIRADQRFTFHQINADIPFAV